MPGRIGNISFDCADVLLVAGFWSEVLGRPLDEGSSTGWASIGGGDAARAEPALYFNKVEEPKAAKNRVHLDVVDPDPQAIDGYVALGATVVENHHLAGPDGGHGWTILADPEGNEFCVAVKSFTGW